MQKFIALSTVAATSLMANAAMAQQACFNDQGKIIACPPVPEISALSGTAAIAALAAVVLLVWERRRRAV